MILGNLTEALENDKNIMDVINENNSIQKNYNGYQYKKPTKWSNILTSLSHYGMNFDDKVYQNMIAQPADRNLLSDEDKLLQGMMFGNTFTQWKVKQEEDKHFSEKTLDQKREVLRKMAMQPELEDILDIMANEAIVYDDDESYIANPFIDTSLVQDLNEESSEKIKKSIDTIFYKMYLLLKLKTNAWDIFKRYLIDGVLCYEIIYDDLEHPKSIIGLVDIDPATVTKKIKDGITYWVQYEGSIARERTLLDTQIIYVKYEDSGVSTRQSYLERLIRPFNLYRIVEQAQVIWTVTQSSFKTLFTIPTAGMNRAKGIQTLAQTMNRYKEDISFNTESGELLVNGKVNMPFNKEYWLPENDNGKPEIETLVDNGPQLNDSDQIKYFESKLYKISKIPENRFDKESQSTWFGSDPTQALRDEITFTRFVNRLRNSFSEIILKPIRIQLTLQLPEIKNDKRILDAVSLRFNSYNLFEEMMNIEVMTKRIEFIGTFKDTLVVTDSEGNEQPYFSPRFLIEKYLKLSQADLELNEKYKLEDKQNSPSEDEDKGGDEEEDNMMGGEDENPTPEENDNTESDEDNEVDQEMMGDVKPESPETTQK